MDVTNYDFESKLEQGFKSLFNTAGINLYIADNVDEVLPDENVRFELSVGGVISDEHLKQGNYDNYGGSIEIQIQTPRVSDDQVAIFKNEADDSIIVSGAGSSDFNDTYVRSGTFGGKPNYISLSSFPILFGTYKAVRWDDNDFSSGQNWIVIQQSLSPSIAYLSNDPVLTPDLASNWTVYDGIAPAPTVAKPSPPLQFKSRQAELVAITRKTIEEIDAAVLLANWPNALSPTKIKPTGTERENDADHRVTKLSYEIQFRIT